MRRAVWRSACFGLTLLAFGNAGRAFADSNALWNFVNGECVPHEIAQHAPAPCSAVSLAGGYAVMNDQKSAYEFLLIPTRRITGIEDSYLQNAQAPNYFADAWAERIWLENRLGERVPRQDIGLDVNSFYGRSQNQLHIHIECLRPGAAAALADHAAQFGANWRPVSMPPSGHIYLVKQIVSPDLSGINPFALIAAGQGSGGMKSEVAVIAGAQLSDGKQGFYLLSGRADLPAGNFGSGEELLDRSCAIIRSKP